MKKVIPITASECEKKLIELGFEFDNADKDQQGLYGVLVALTEGIIELKEEVRKLEHKIRRPFGI